MEVPKDWGIQDEKLVRLFTFENYEEIVDFIKKFAQIAEEENHRPDFRVFGYKNIEISLCTHDKGNIITNLDILVARRINELV